MDTEIKLLMVDDEIEFLDTIAERTFGAIITELGVCEASAKGLRALYSAQHSVR